MRGARSANTLARIAEALVPSCGGLMRGSLPAKPPDVRAGARSARVTHDTIRGTCAGNRSRPWHVVGRMSHPRRRSRVSYRALLALSLVALGPRAAGAQSPPVSVGTPRAGRIEGLGARLPA